MDQALDYEVIYSGRKTLAVTVTADGQVIVRAPERLPKGEIRKFIEKQGWIRHHMKLSAERKRNQKKIRMTAKERENYKKEAKTVITRLCRIYAEQMGVSCGKITIREQKTRWGSASSRGNLNFNWKLILMPRKVLEYVVVHELAHLKVMNHSPAFYEAVAQYMPDYEQPKTWLSKHGAEYNIHLIS